MCVHVYMCVCVCEFVCLCVCVGMWACVCVSVCVQIVHAKPFVCVFSGML